MSSNRRAPPSFAFLDDSPLRAIGLSQEALANAIDSTYHLLDRIDATLIGEDVAPLCQMVELANLSSMIGNIIGAELAKHSHGAYCRNQPHRYPDLLPLTKSAAQSGIEIKMALGKNAAKGHLAKEGHYIICKYVLVDSDGHPIRTKEERPNARYPVFWEIKSGYLTENCFNISNTAGDSGKTAVINAVGNTKLVRVFHDGTKEPSSRSPVGSAGRRPSRTPVRTRRLL